MDAKDAEEAEVKGNGKNIARPAGAQRYKGFNAMDAKDAMGTEVKNKGKTGARRAGAQHYKGFQRNGRNGR